MWSIHTGWCWRGKPAFILHAVAVYRIDTYIVLTPKARWVETLRPICWMILYHSWSMRPDYSYISRVSYLLFGLLTCKHNCCLSILYLILVKIADGCFMTSEWEWKKTTTMQWLQSSWFVICCWFPNTFACSWWWF